MAKAMARVVAVVVGTTAACGVSVMACGSPAESTFAAEPPKAAVEPQPLGSLVPDGGASGDGAGKAEARPDSCVPAIPPTFAPAWAAPTKSVACSAEELTGYYDACLVNPRETELNGACERFKANHATCASCTEPKDQTGPVQWQLGRKFFTINVAGCIAIAQNALAAGTCGDTYNAAVQCARQSCESCFDVGGSFNQFRECQKNVQQTGICKSYEAALAATCAGYKSASSPALACFNRGGETEEAHFTRVVGLFCGP